MTVKKIIFLVAAIGAGLVICSMSTGCATQGKTEFESVSYHPDGKGGYDYYKEKGVKRSARALDPNRVIPQRAELRVRGGLTRNMRPHMRTANICPHCHGRAHFQFEVCPQLGVSEEVYTMTQRALGEGGPGACELHNRQNCTIPVCNGD